jgi:hypothetical protein
MCLKTPLTKQSFSTSKMGVCLSVKLWDIMKHSVTTLPNLSLFLVLITMVFIWWYTFKLVFWIHTYLFFRREPNLIPDRSPNLAISHCCYCRHKRCPIFEFMPKYQLEFPPFFLSFVSFPHLYAIRQSFSNFKHCTFCCWRFQLQLLIYLFISGHVNL